MKFGQQLRTSLIRDYYNYYISYDGLKSELKSRLYPPGTVFCHGNPKPWNEEDEQAFVAVLEAELDKVYTFQKVRSTFIVRAIKDAEREVEHVIKKLENRRRNGERSESPEEEEFLALEDDLSEIIADVHDLAKFTQLNYTGFQKIIKKHDKQTGWPLKPIFSTRLNAKPFFKDNYDAFIVNLSRLYDLVRTRGSPVEGDSAAGGGQQNFVRNTTKYWVHPDNITELKLIILKHLPVLVFNPNKDFEAADTAISSIYYDNDDFELYLGRLQKTEGAEAHRLRWYGKVDVPTVFVERKTHREDWTGEKSVKARFPLKEKNVNAFLKGEYTVEQAFEKMRKDNKKPQKEIESLEALAREVQYTMISKRLHPVVRSFYHRTAFQLPGDARVRISLDTELSLIREDNMGGRRRAGDNWRRTDIGIDWPFSKLPAEDIERFPYAILEVKLQTQAGQEPPRWIRDLVASHLVEAVPKFSKFLHGAATLFPEDINLLPFWIPQMDVDIRKPVSQLGINRPGNTSSESAGGFFGDSDDELFQPRDLNAWSTEPDFVPDRMRSPGNSLDEEERVAATGMRPNDYALYDSEAEDSDENSSSSSSLLGGRRRRRPQRSVWQNVTTALSNAWSYTQTHLVPGPMPSVANTGPQDQRVLRRFKAPPGKRIFVPVRVEPKVYFAAERTFLSWLEFSLYISTVAITLLNFGNKATVRAALVFTFLAVACLVYSLGLYIYRMRKMRARRAVRYHDKYGPTGLCVLMFLGVVINFVLKMKDDGR